MGPGTDPLLLVPEAGEYAVRLEPAQNPDVMTYEEAAAALPDHMAVDAYFEQLAGNKLGGTPGFIQSEEFPLGREAHFVLQLDSADVPFSVNFGDSGVGYLFVSVDWQQGRFLWHCAWPMRATVLWE